MEKSKLIKALELKGFFGTIDKLHHGKITEELAKAELDGDNSHLLAQFDQNASDFLGPADFAAKLKSRGVGRQESWSRWVQYTRIKPGMDAKDWYKIYDSVAQRKEA